MANDSRMEIVISARDQATAAVKELSAGLKRLQSELGTTGKAGVESFDDTAKAAKGAASGTSDMVAPLMAVAGAVALVGTAFKAAIAGIEKFEQTTINIASQLTNMAAEGQGSYKEMFERNQAYAKVFYDKLRQYDAERASSIEEMMLVYNSLVTQGYQVRMDEAKALSLITDLIKQKTASQGFEIQAFQEIRALLDGQANQHARLAMELKERIGPAWSDILKSHEKAGTLLTYLTSLYPGVEASSEAMQKTLEAQNTTLQSQLTYIGRQGLQGAYDDIVSVVQRINNYLKEHADVIAEDIAKGWQSVRSVLLGIPDLVKSGVTEMRAFVASIEELAQNPFIMMFLGAAAGYRFGGLPGSLAGAATAGFMSAENIKKAAQARELKQYEVDPLEGEPTAAQLSVLSIEQTKKKVKDDLKQIFEDAAKEGLQGGMSKGYYAAVPEIAKRLGMQEYSGVLQALMKQESGGRQYAAPGMLLRSPKGATGLMQLMPGTAASMGLDAADPQQNIYGGILYFKQMLARFNNDVAKALAAYNAGPGNVEKWFGKGEGRPFDITRVPFAETRKYVTSVLGTAEKWGLPEYERGLQESENAAQKAAAERAKATEKKIKDEWKAAEESIRSAEKAGNAIDKIELDITKYHQKTIEEKKRTDEEYLTWRVRSLQEIMGSESLPYGERRAAGAEYREAGIAAIDSELTGLREKYGYRISEESLQKYRQVQVANIDEQIKQAASPQILDWEAAWKRAAENVQDTLANFIENLITNSRSGADILKNILSSATRMMSQMAAQALMNIAKVAMESMSMGSGGKSGLGGILSGIAGFAGKIFGGMFGGGSAASTTSWTTGGAANPSNFSSWTSSYATFGDGAVFPRGFTPIGQYGDGAVFASPTLGIIGERYEPEAVVPLDRYDISKKGEASGQSGQGGDIQIINVWDPAMVADIARQTISSDAGREIVLNIVQTDLAERGVTRRSLRRS